ncbi:ferric reductase [Pleomassaria siparia CBS 279.74]|uniref:ferric-chelate reductase (NADPH) n=1 Tax=Pleomassaria siparia CBS 279.74 TaxID=1314801 RepID=A0A6G1KL81_9PLEO|nr:ferric reductase [Pleomassaria siparia CBS 279.74]
MPPTTTLEPDVNNINYTSSSDPFKYSHGFTGVDQPQNYLFTHILLGTALSFGLAAFVYRIWSLILHKRMRVAVIATLNNVQYWGDNTSSFWPWMKRNLLYAPLGTTQYRREVHITKGISIGTLPSRLRLIIVILYTIPNVLFCLEPVLHTNTAKPDIHHTLAELRGRTGTLAVYNLVLAILFALRNNPLIWILGIGYDTFNFFHRWTARLLFMQVLGHITAWAYNTYRTWYDGEGGWDSIHWMFEKSQSYRWAVVGFLAFVFLVSHSINPLRHAFYEVFLATHRLGIFAALVGVYNHLHLHALPQLPWVCIIIGFIVGELLFRIIRIIRANCGWREYRNGRKGGRGRMWTRASIEALPGEVTRVTFEVPNTWNKKPGAHVHVWIPRLAWWQSHPFSVAWKPPSTTATTATLGPPSIVETGHAGQADRSSNSVVTCMIRAQGGFTRKLYNLASSPAFVASSSSSSSSKTLFASLEGPYATLHSLTSHSTVLLFAGGIGITQQLSFLPHLLRGYNTNTTATRKILLVWCIPNLDCLSWITPFLDQIRMMRNFGHVASIRVFVSRSDSQGGAEGGMRIEGVDISRGRCNVQGVLEEQVRNRVGAMVVSVCGPGMLSDSVRKAVRNVQGKAVVDLVEEAFDY